MPAQLRFWLDVDNTLLDNDALQEKHMDDREALRKAQMDFFKEESTPLMRFL